MRFAVALLVMVFTVAAQSFGRAQTIEDAETAYLRGDYRFAVDWIHNRADLNDPAVQHFLAAVYTKGIGLPGNNAEAARLLRAAAEQEYADAQYELGLAFQPGSGFSLSPHVKRDKGQALEWLRKAAKVGHAAAQYKVGMAYWDGWGVEESHSEAVMWLKRAAENENADAQYQLGFLYKIGGSVEKNDERAVIWNRRAAQHGNPSALLELGERYAEGRGVVRDDFEALKWLYVASINGIYSMLISELEESFSSEQINSAGDQAQAITSQQGGYNAQYLGLDYHHETGSPLDKALALDWYRDKANRGDARAKNNLGVMFSNGWGTKPDFPTAENWFRSAASDGYAPAQFNLAVLIQVGAAKSVSADETEFTWYQRAARQGHFNARFRIDLFNGIDLSSLMGADEAENPKCCFAPIDSHDAFLHFLKQAQSGSASAKYNLGVMYANGWGVEQDLLQATKWLTLAVGASVEQARVSLEKLEDAPDVLEQDHTAAVSWFLKSAREGNARSQFKLGVMLEHGMGVAKNLGEAIKWYRESAENGYPTGQLFLGIAAGPQSETHAEFAKWISLAASSGFREAVLFRDQFIGVLKNEDRSLGERQALEWIKAQ